MHSLRFFHTEWMGETWNPRPIQRFPWSFREKKQIKADPWLYIQGGILAASLFSGCLQFGSTSRKLPVPAHISRPHSYTRVLEFNDAYHHHVFEIRLIIGPLLDLVIYCIKEVYYYTASF